MDKFGVANSQKFDVYASRLMPREEFFTSGHRSCQGCGEALAVRWVCKAIGKDAVIASVTVNIPFWWEKRKASVREGQARLASTSKGAEALKHSLISDMELALYKYRDAQRKIDLYLNTLLPKAEEALAVTLEAFQAGSRTSLDLIDAEKTLLEFQLSYIRALADQAQRVAELEMLLGKEIPCEIHGVVLPKQGGGLKP